jgi:hypothetical protein
MDGLGFIADPDAENTGARSGGPLRDILKLGFGFWMVDGMGKLDRIVA